MELPLKDRDIQRSHTKPVEPRRPGSVADRLGERSRVRFGPRFGSTRRCLEREGFHRPLVTSNAWGVRPRGEQGTRKQPMSLRTSDLWPYVRSELRTIPFDLS